MAVASRESAVQAKVVLVRGSKRSSRCSQITKRPLTELGTDMSMPIRWRDGFSVPLHQHYSCSRDRRPNPDYPRRVRVRGGEREKEKEEGGRNVEDGTRNPPVDTGHNSVWPGPPNCLKSQNDNGENPRSVCTAVVNEFRRRARCLLFRRILLFDRLKL